MFWQLDVSNLPNITYCRIVSQFWKQSTAAKVHLQTWEVLWSSGIKANQTTLHSMWKADQNLSKWGINEEGKMDENGQYGNTWKKILEQKDAKGCKRHSMLSSQLPQLCGGRSERKAKTFIVLCSCALALLHRGKWNWNLDNELLLNALHWALSNSTFQGKTWWQQWPAKALTVASPQAGQKIWDREEWLTARQHVSTSARQSSSCTWPHTLEGYESRLTSSPSLRHQFPSSKSPFGVQR